MSFENFQNKQKYTPVSVRATKMHTFVNLVFAGETKTQVFLDKLGTARSSLQSMRKRAIKARHIPDTFAFSENNATVRAMLLEHKSTKEISETTGYTVAWIRRIRRAMIEDGELVEFIPQKLHTREKRYEQVQALLAKNMRTSEIAAKLGIQPSTVSKYIYDGRRDGILPDTIPKITTTKRVAVLHLEGFSLDAISVVINRRVDTVRKHLEIARDCGFIPPTQKTGYMLKHLSEAMHGLPLAYKHYALEQMEEGETFAEYLLSLLKDAYHDDPKYGKFYRDNARQE